MNLYGSPWLLISQYPIHRRDNLHRHINQPLTNHQSYMSLVLLPLPLFNRQKPLQLLTQPHRLLTSHLTLSHLPKDILNHSPHPFPCKCTFTITTLGTAYRSPSSPSLYPRLNCRPNPRRTDISSTSKRMCKRSASREKSWERRRVSAW